MTTYRYAKYGACKPLFGLINWVYMNKEGNNTGVAPDTPKWPELIKQKRTELGETQAEFGARFKVTYVAVSLWEAGKRDVPGEVTWWLVQEGVLNGQSS